MKNTKSISILLLLAVTAVVGWYAYAETTPPQTGVYGEASILKWDEATGTYGEEIPLGKKVGMTLYRVNNAEVSGKDVIATRAWVRVRSNGIAGEITRVKFQVHCKIAGPNGGITDLYWGTASDPATPETETWLTPTLPKDEWVQIDLKFVDKPHTKFGEAPGGVPWCPYRHTYGSYFLADRHTYAPEGFEGGPDGRYDLTITFHVTELTYVGQTTEIITDQDYEMQFTLNYSLTKTTTGISIQFGGSGSH